MGKPPLKLKKRLLSNKQRNQHKFLLGEQGEQTAVAFLLAHHFQILDTNVTYKHHEVDIVALDTINNEVVFFEVKTRSSTEFGHPSNAISPAKLSSMQYLAVVYCNIHQLEQDYRFDVITVLPHKVEHFENVTWNY